VAYVGGIRSRLIRDSTFRMLRDCLDVLGWFDTGRKHKPVTMRYSAVPMGTEVPPNTIALADENVAENEEELGSNLASHRWTMYVDFYAENETIGMHLINDIKAILGGRIPSIGRVGPFVKVYDYTQATPRQIFIVDVENIQVDRAHDFPHHWLRYWYSCQFVLVDYYGDETDINTPLGQAIWQDYEGTGMTWDDLTGIVWDTVESGI